MDNRKKEGLSPLQKVDAARNLLIATMYICSSIAEGKLPLSIFNSDLVYAPNDETIFISTEVVANIVVSIGDKQMYVKKRKWNDVDLGVLQKNLLLGVFGVCWIALDEALDSKFGEKPKHYSDTDKDQLRAIIYMIRCAFAHTPTAPIWDIRQNSRKEFHIKEINMTIDFRELNGKKLFMADHGGWIGYFKLTSLSEKYIRAND